jgi:hypothetical protein
MFMTLRDKNGIPRLEFSDAFFSKVLSLNIGRWGINPVLQSGNAYIILLDGIIKDGNNDIRVYIDKGDYFN